MFPEAILELRKQFERVVTHDLPADVEGVFFAEFTTLDFLDQGFGQAAAGKLRGAA